MAVQATECEVPALIWWMGMLSSPTTFLGFETGLWQFPCNMFQLYITVNWSTCPILNKIIIKLGQINPPGRTVPPSCYPRRTQYYRVSRPGRGCPPHRCLLSGDSAAPPLSGVLVPWRPGSPERGEYYKHRNVGAVSHVSRVFHMCVQREGNNWSV